MKRNQIVIIGASTRAAAYSALRAGWRPWCVDLFADADLQAVARVERSLRYPHDLPDLAARFPDAPWMFTGALENNLSVVKCLNKQRPLWGCSVAAIKSVRDPITWTHCLAEAGLPTLEVLHCDRAPPADGTWLVKPLRGAAGKGIVPWNQIHQSSAKHQRGQYFQKRAHGLPMSAVFIGHIDETRLIGVTRQILGCDGYQENPWAYCGSIGPISLPTNVMELIAQIGRRLAVQFDLRGMFGCDFVYESETERPFVVEVNPRYTASVEVLERAQGESIFRAHVGLFDEEKIPSTIEIESHIGTAGKLIVYAECDLVVSAGDFPESTGEFQPFPGIADIPAMGTRIFRGEPICTLFAEARDSTECERNLRAARRAILDRWTKDR